MDPAVIVDSSVDFFRDKPLLKSFIKTKEIEIEPLDGWRTGARITFKPPRKATELYESDGFVLETEMQILKPDGSTPDATK